MRNSVRKLLYAAMVVPITCMAAGDERCDNKLSSPSLKVTLVANDKEFFPGKPVSVTVTIQNMGESDIAVPTTMEVPDYWLRFVIKDSSGSMAKFIGPERKILNYDRMLVLAPHYRYGVEVQDLSKQYSLDMRVAYTVQAVYGEPPVGSCVLGSLKSNVIKIRWAKQGGGQVSAN